MDLGINAKILGTAGSLSTAMTSYLNSPIVLSPLPTLTFFKFHIVAT